MLKKNKMKTKKIMAEAPNIQCFKKTSKKSKAEVYGLQMLNVIGNRSFCFGMFVWAWMIQSDILPQ